MAGGSGDPGGAAPPVMALDPDALRGVANEAAARAEELLAVVTAAGPWLADVPGDLRTIAVLRSCATNRLADANALTDRIGAVASKLTDTVTEYATVDDDLAARLTAMLAERE